MTVTYDVFDQDLSESIPTYVARLDAYLQALGPIGLQDIALSKRQNIGRIRYELTLQYITPGSVVFRAATFAERTDADLAAAMALFFSVLPSARVQFIRDISQEVRRNTVQNAVLVLYTTSIVPNCGADRGRPVIVEVVGDIVSGASGLAHVVDADGLTADSITVTNRGGSTWAGGARGYAAADLGTCDWSGYPSCC